MQKRWIKPVIALVVLLVIAAISARYFVTTTSAAKVSSQAQSEQTSDPAGECASCHEMKPEILTWQVTAHEKFACKVCHVDKKAANYVGKHQSQAYSTPIKMVDAIPNSACLQCHTSASNRMSSPSGDLKIPHDKHLEAGVACVKCHSGVAHAKIAERDLSSIIAEPNNYEAWNLETAKKVATKPYIQPSMWTCIECHKQANVSRKCGACHTTIPTLPSHDQANWRSDHGQYARSDIQVCVSCHAAPGVPTFVTPSTGDKALDFARAQQFCSNCHTQRPEFHEKSMMPIHPGQIAKRGAENCLACHTIKQPQPTEKVPKVYCNQCHWFETAKDIVIKSKNKK